MPQIENVLAGLTPLAWWIVLLVYRSAADGKANVLDV